MVACLFLFLAASCANYRVQVTEPALNGVPSSDLIVHDGDSIRVAYWFWDEKGVMAFSIFNASDRPIYIDWFKCALIHQGSRLPYWSEQQSIKIRGFTQSSSITISDVVGFYNRVTGTAGGRGSENTVARSYFMGSIAISKPERVSFIPPKSHLFVNTRWNLVSGTFKGGWTNSMVPATHDPDRMVEVKIREHERGDTPLTFRNFITWSFNDDFRQEHYVDDEFWIKRVTSMTRRQFRGKCLKENQSSPCDYEYPFKSASKFYYEFKE